MFDYFDRTLELADMAALNGDVPVGAVVVFNNEIIAEAYNSKVDSNDVIKHAEIVAVQRAAHKMGDWRLNDCDLYVTLEPCDMCKEVLKQSRVRNVYYLIEKVDYKKGYNKTKFIKADSNQVSYQQSKYKEKLSTFFKLNCKR